MKKNAFSLAEIVICLTLLGFLSVLCVTVIDTARFREKSIIAASYKGLAALEEATAKLKQSEKNCPMSSFIVDVAGNPQLLVLKNNGNPIADSSDLRDVFASVLKTESLLSTKIIGTADSADTDSSTADIETDSLPALTLAGEVHLAFELLTPGGDGYPECPKFRTIRENFNESHELHEVKIGNNDREPGTTVRDRCWARVYIDANGSKEPNVIGQDIYVYGLNRLGIAK